MESGADDKKTNKHHWTRTQHILTGLEERGDENLFKTNVYNLQEHWESSEKKLNEAKATT